MQSFQKYWLENFGDEPPLSYRFKNSFHKNWIRFHALPESKRYADTQNEYDIILERANILAGIVLGENSQCWAFSNIPKELLLEEDKDILQFIKKFEMTKNFTFEEKEEDPTDRPQWVSFSGLTKWKNKKFDAHLLEIADDEAWPKLSWVSTENNNIFAPYDGGFDVISYSTELISELRSKFSQWLSSHPEGL